MKRMVIALTGLLLIAGQLYAGNGDLIVDGNIGVGTTSPLDKLDINFGAVRWGYAPEPNSYYARSYLVPIGNGDANETILKFEVKSFPNEVATNPLTLTGAGNVGIGTSYPYDRLDINLGAIRWGYAPEPTTYYARSYLVPVGNGNANETLLKFEVKSFPNEVATNPLTLTGAGNVGIGTSSPGEKLVVDGAVKLTSNPTVINSNNAAYFWNQAGVGPTLAGYQFEIQTNGNTPRFKIDYLGKVGIGTTNPAYTLDVNGTISGSNVSPSDIRLKENISPVELALEKVSNLRGVSFDWKQGEYGKSFPEGRHYGVIAQEIEKVLPEVVSTAPDGTKAVAYTEIIPVLIEAIKELQREVESLKKR